MKTGEDIYIIGGGPSLKEFDFKLLAGLDTIAVNMAALDVPDPTFCITADSRIFQLLQEGKFDQVKTSWILVSNPNHCTMKMVNGQFKHQKTGYVYDLFVPTMVIKNAGTEGVGFSFNDFRTGYNSGFCAFQLAVLLGYKRIHLLGIDMGGVGHYHNRYKGRIIPDYDLDRYYNNFVLAINTVENKTNIKVISHSTTSRLNKVIPYIPFKSPFIRPEDDPNRSVSSVSKARPVNAPKTTLKAPTLVSAGLTVDTGFKLSILICSLENRKSLLNRLLVETDGGQLTTGGKRNLLLTKAVGDYVAFVDDDDLVSDNYVQLILQAIKTGPDCCSLTGQMTNKRGNFKFVHSLKYDHWFKDGQVYFRCPNHLNAVKRELALKTAFVELTVGEDKDYSLRLQPLLKTEVQIDETIYYYLTR